MRFHIRFKYEIDKKNVKIPWHFLSAFFSACISALHCFDNIFTQPEKQIILKNNNSGERQKSGHWNIMLCYALRHRELRMANAN